MWYSLLNSLDYFGELSFFNLCTCVTFIQTWNECIDDFNYLTWRQLSFFQGNYPWVKEWEHHLMRAKRRSSLHSISSSRRWKTSPWSWSRQQQWIASFLFHGLYLFLSFFLNKITSFKVVLSFLISICYTN